MNDLISRQAAIDLIKNDAFWVQYAWGGRGHKPEMEMVDDLVESIIKQMKESVVSRLEQMPSAQPEQRYTEEELRVFQHGISLSLLSKRSSQHWQYDEDTATEIKFLERLYEKVVADMRGEQDGRFNQQAGGD